MREASLALSATKLETTLRVVLPAVMPSILTGLILAMARAAGEVAPLMITGVVKLAPALPVDGFWPFLHLDRKFMHLGFHIYDVGFQSPNVDAARPMVFATTLLLLAIVVLLNLFAISAAQPPAPEVRDRGGVAEDSMARRALRGRRRIASNPDRRGGGRPSWRPPWSRSSASRSGTATKLALKDVSMSVPKHRVTAYIGPSGCGKSTLLRCLNRMNDLVDGVRITGHRPDRRHRHLRPGAST